MPLPCARGLGLGGLAASRSGLRAGGSRYSFGVRTRVLVRLEAVVLLLLGGAELGAELPLDSKRLDHNVGIRAALPVRRTSGLSTLGTVVTLPPSL